MPLYDLDKVKEAAQRGNIRYRGRDLYRDIENLGYDLAEVKRCILQLTESDFIKRVKYKNTLYEDDSYKTKYIRTDEFGDKITPDFLYLKLRLINNTLEINLGSFHLCTI